MKMSKAMSDAMAELAKLDRKGLAQEARREIARRVVRELDKQLAAYRFTPNNERDLQEQILDVLSTQKNLIVREEVRARTGRYDIQVETLGVRVVLELKVTGSPSEVERQAQRYALEGDVDAVAVVTTSNRLARAIGRHDTLGGKPFAVVALRSF